MAIKGAARWKPDSYRTTLEATVLGLNPTGETTDPETGETTQTGTPEGTVVMTAQLVAYDDTQLTGQNYQAGHPDTERKLVVLYEETVMKSLGGFASMTQAEAAAEWATALQAFSARVAPAGPALVKAIRAARTAPPVLI